MHFKKGALVVCGRTIHSNNSVATPPHTGHRPGHTLLWDGISFFNQHLSQVSQSGCVGHSARNSMSKLIPQMFNRVEVRTAGWPFHPLHSQILSLKETLLCVTRLVTSIRSCHAVVAVYGSSTRY